MADTALARQIQEHDLGVAKQSDLRAFTESRDQIKTIFME